MQFPHPVLSQPSCLPGLQFQGTLLPGHQEGVGKLSVTQFPDLLRKVEGVLRGITSPTHPNQLLGCCRLNVPLSTIGIRGMGSGEWALVLPTPHVPSEQSKWVPKHEIWSILAPDIFSAAQLAWCEVGVTIPGKRFPQHEHYPPQRRGLGGLK